MQPLLDKAATAGRSPASYAIAAASNGASAGNGGCGYEGDLWPYLFVAMGPDRCHPVKARAVRAPASRLAALTGCAGSASGRHATRRLQAFLRRKSMTRTSDFRRGIPGCFIRWTLTRERRYGRGRGTEGALSSERQRIAQRRAHRSPHSADRRSHRPTACSRAG